MNVIPEQVAIATRPFITGPADISEAGRCRISPDQVCELLHVKAVDPERRSAGHSCKSLVECSVESLGPCARLLHRSIAPALHCRGDSHVGQVRDQNVGSPAGYEISDNGPEGLDCRPDHRISVRVTQGLENIVSAAVNDMERVGSPIIAPEVSISLRAQADWSRVATQAGAAHGKVQSARTARLKSNTKALREVLDPDRAI
jgi:hypothetical protein